MTTLADIGAALLTQLQTLGPSPGTAAFAYVGWYAGELTVPGADEELLGNVPAALLAYEGSDVVEREGVRTLAKPVSATVTRAGWRVYVLVQDPRGETVAAQGVSSTPGYLGLEDAVQGALTGLPISGLLRSAVEYVGTRPATTQRGVLYAYAVRFATEYTTPAYDPGASTLPALSIVGNIDLDDADGLLVDDFVSFEPDLT